MSRRIKRTQTRSDRRDDRPAQGRDKRPFRQAERTQTERPKARLGKPKAGFRSQPKPARLAAERGEQRRPAEQPAKPAKPALEPAALPTKVQTVVVTADENNMRVDRFLEARFPGLSFSHIQRIVRKGELRVNG